MAELMLPASEDSVRALKVGDFVELSGRMITGRDTAHKWLVEEYRDEVASYLEDTVIYHCGPVVAETPDGGWEFKILHLELRIPPNDNRPPRNGGGRHFKPKN